MAVVVVSETGGFTHHGDGDNTGIGGGGGVVHDVRPDLNQIPSPSQIDHTITIFNLTQGFHLTTMSGVFLLACIQGR